MAKFCENCGAALNPSAKFCRDCGNAVAAAVAPASVGDASLRVPPPPQEQFWQPPVPHPQYQQAHPQYQEAQPQYQPQAYPPPPQGTNKMLIAIIAGVAAVALIVAGIFLVPKFFGVDDAPDDTIWPDSYMATSDGDGSNGDVATSDGNESDGNVTDGNAAAPDGNAPDGNETDGQTDVDGGDPLFYPDLNVIPPAILAEADASIDFGKYMDMTADGDKTYSGQGVTLIENPMAAAFIIGGFDELGMAMIAEVDGTVYAAMGEMWNENSRLVADFTESAMASSRFVNMYLDEAHFQGGVATISAMESVNGASVTMTMTAVFMQDGRLFCQTRADISSDSEEGAVTIRFLLEPDAE